MVAEFRTQIYNAIACNAMDCQNAGKVTYFSSRLWVKQTARAPAPVRDHRASASCIHFVHRTLHSLLLYFAGYIMHALCSIMACDVERYHTAANNYVI